LGQLALDGRLRAEAVDDFFGERVIGGHVLTGKDNDSRREAVAQCVQARACRRGLGTRLTKSISLVVRATPYA
jgi:hypothetical protein